MTVMSHLPNTCLSLALALVAAVPASAQSLSYGDMGDSGEEADSGASSGSRESGRRAIRISPYIEAAQVATAELKPGNDVLTYTRAAAGLDASIQGRRTGLSASVRYEHYFGWGRKASDADVVSGVVRGYATVTPGLQVEAGGLAARTRVEGNGGTSLGPVGVGNDTSNIYSVYAGPTVATRVGDVQVTGGYRIGYTRVESPDAVVTAPGQAPVDVFDDSVSHNASLRAGVKPGDVLPVGVGIGANWNREDISNLDQRAEDRNIRGDVIVPVTASVALVGGVGYEDVKVSSRDAVRDGLGNPVIGPGGRYVTDKSAPRRIAFETDGLIWDAGVVWRPNRRTMLEARVGKRYGSTTYQGSFSYAPNARSSLNVSVYDALGGFGGRLNTSLAALPTDFEANRDVLTGNLTGCVASTKGNNCLASALGSVRSSVFRGRGITASYGADLGRIKAGIGLGYDRRKFVGTPGTVLALADGLIDERYWMAGYMTARTSERGSLSGNAYVNWFEPGDALAGDYRTVGGSVSYGHLLTNRLSATAALGLDGVLRDDPALQDFWTASALVGLRYSF